MFFYVPNALQNTLFCGYGLNYCLKNGFLAIKLPKYSSKKINILYLMFYIKILHIRKLFLVSI